MVYRLEERDRISSEGSELQTRVNLDPNSSDGRPVHVFVLRQWRGARRIAAASSRPRGHVHVLEFNIGYRVEELEKLGFGAVLFGKGSGWLMVMGLVYVLEES
ncbi:hypothetical protein ACLB2K_065833 [Fragaria x ananassa]